MRIITAFFTSLAFTTVNAFTIQNKSLSSLSSNPTSTHLMSSPKSGDVATVNFSLTPNGDFVPDPLFDDGKVTFVLDGGNYLPGLHTLLSKMTKGEAKSGVTLDAGWGDKRDDLIAKVPIATSGVSKSDLSIGTELFLANGMKCKVIEIDDEEFTIDANPPLAGATYSADVTLESFESGPSQAQFEYHPEKIDGTYDVLTIALGCFWVSL